MGLEGVDWGVNLLLLHWSRGGLTLFVDRLLFLLWLSGNRDYLCFFFDRLRRSCLLLNGRRGLILNDRRLGSINDLFRGLNRLDGWFFNEFRWLDRSFRAFHWEFFGKRWNLLGCFGILLLNRGSW